MRPERFRDALPQTVIDRIWVLYKTGLPDRFYIPQPNQMMCRAEEEGDRHGEVVDRAVA